VSLHISRGSLYGSKVILSGYRVSLHALRLSLHNSRVLVMAQGKPPKVLVRKHKAGNTPTLVNTTATTDIKFLENFNVKT
jgi:hypothetical protein